MTTTRRQSLIYRVSGYPGVRERKVAKDKTKPGTPTGLAAEIVSPTIVDLTWNAASDPSAPDQSTSGVKGYRLFRDGTKIADLGPVLTYSDTGRTPTRTYRYSVASVDNRNNQSLPSAQITVTMPPLTQPSAPDTSAPSVPGNVTATALDAARIGLTWSASTDPTVAGQERSGLAGYRVFRDTTLIATLGLVTTYDDTGLAAGTEYAYRVSARDNAGNESAGAAVSATTDATDAPDTTAPSVPTGLVATAVSSSQITLTWAAASDPSVPGQETGGVMGYKLYRSGVLRATLGNVLTYDDTGLSASTQYPYRVAAVDAAGNASAQSAQVVATTQVAGGGGGNEIVAASASLADVQAAVNIAVDGDTVLIPNGSAAWAGGITTSKKLIFRAQNYTPTPGGTMTRSVTITHNAGGSALIAMTTGNNHHVGVVGLRFNDGSGTGNFVRFGGSGSKVPLIGDCAFEFEARNGNNPGGAMIAAESLGGVMWNTYLLGLGNVQTALGGLGMFVSSPRSWQSASTMGPLDVNGNINLYIENCTMLNLSTFIDVDQGGRAVVRNSVIDGSFFLTHGFTSGMYNGGRHVEIYDNTLRVTTTLRNMAGRYFWLRAGTVVMTGNNVANATDLSYGNVTALVIGDNTAPSGTDGPMQPGWGHNGAADVRDPIYMWSNTGARGSSVGFENSAGNWQAVTSSQELVVDQGAKPNWSRFTYPHPARAAVEG